MTSHEIGLLIDLEFRIMVGRVVDYFDQGEVDLLFTRLLYPISNTL
jgi:hypothetical protein